MPSLIRLLAVVALLRLLATGCDANTHLAHGYAMRVWQTDDGLPENLVTSGTQTSDGYLWFGTHNGLVRFNGAQFQVFDSSTTPELPDRRIARLFEDSEGSLWIGHESGAITRYHAGRFEAFAAAPEGESEKIIGLGSDEQGRLWAMRENGALDAVRGGERLPSLLAGERPAIMGWSRGADGAIWVTENWQAARLTNGSLVPVHFDTPRSPQSVAAVASAADGGVWVLSDDRIRKWKDGRWIEDRGAFPWPPAALSCCLELQDGTLAVGTIRFGLYLIYGDGREPVHLDRPEGLPQSWVRFLCEDREGNLWVGAGRSGLVSIHATPFSVLSAPDQWDGCAVLSVAPARDGGLWIGTDGAGLYRYFAGSWTRYGIEEGLTNGYVWAVTETAAGDVWAGSYWWGGPYRLDGGRFVRPENVDETWSATVALLEVEETGELLVGNRDGLLRLKDGEPSQWLIKSPRGGTDDVCALARDREGVIWCGFAQGGLARFKDGEVSIFRRGDGLGSDAVQCLLADEGGSLWIGTADNGLTRLKDGRFTDIGIEHGLLDTTISHILDDGHGYFWLSTHHGIQRVAKAELHRCADGQVAAFSSQTYGRNDGLPIVEFTGGRLAAGGKTADGRLWFANSKGLVSIDPTRIRPNPLPPPVVIESLIVDGRTMPVSGSEVQMRLTPDHQRLEFRFSGLSFMSPDKVRFKLRLDGIDEPWEDVSSMRAAFFSRLPAGTYRFRVTACNNDGVWNTEGASLAFTVAPFFWQTWWFVSSSALAGLSLFALLIRFLTRQRMQHRMKELQRQHAIERERARIAQDIHDDVGSSLARIAMLSQPAHGTLAEPQRTAAMLSRIYTAAREMTKALDEIVWAVDPRHDTLDSLVSYMGKLGQEYLAPADIRCRLRAPVRLPSWRITSETRHALYLAFKEALNNVLKHAAATEVHVTLELQAEAFVLTIKDNGRGFDPRNPKPSASDRILSGNGLSNMQRRLASIGGRCDISSEPRQGTSVSFRVYVQGQKASSSRLGRLRRPKPGRTISS